MDVLATRRSTEPNPRIPARKMVAFFAALACTLILCQSTVFAQAPVPLTDPEPAAEENVTTESPESAEPYIVFVAENEAHTRCGPGKDHYRTEPLRRGQELEVYVETEEGWLGVRPLDESFCWLEGEAVSISGDGQIATIREDETVIWIGTLLGQAKRYRWQVQLDAGEVVSVIDSIERESSEGKKTWLKIVPPSGEFRWVHRDQIAENAEQLAERIAMDVRRGPTLAQADDLVPIATGDLKDAQRADTSNSAVRTASANTENAESPTASSGGTLRAVNEIPKLTPLPENDALSEARPIVEDRAIQFHRNADAENYEDRGAVIGSGLKPEYQTSENENANGETIALTGGLSESEGSSVLSGDSLEPLPASGAAAAAAAISDPIRRVTDVVANFISPPRLVQIDPTGVNLFTTNTAADQRWQVGSTRRQNTAPLAPPSSLALAGSSRRIVPGSTVTADHSTVVGTVTGPTYGSALGIPVGAQVLPAGGQAAGSATPAPSRVISAAQITRVQDAVGEADVETVAEVLSKLIAEGASAVEVDPLVQRTEALLRSGDVTLTHRTREVQQRARQYRDLAIRRDGPTTISATAQASFSAPLVSDSSISKASATLPIQQGTSSAAELSTANAIPQVGQHYGAPQERPLSTASPIPSSPSLSEGNATGYLVEVYSTRTNCPPYALTDDAGLTIAYVTPYPGVNLRNHLNSRISVAGSEKLLEGMSTPHILVNRAIRR